MSYAAAGMQALNNASIRNQGGQAGLLGGPGAIDGSTQSFWNLADPFNTTGNASSGHFFSNLLDPGNVLGQNQAANPLGPNGANANNASSSTAQFPNLGASTLTPVMPGGSFQPIQNGNGRFNNMAAQGAGGLMFNPATQTPAQPAQTPAQPAQSTGGSKPTASSVNTGGTPYSSIALPGGGGNPALGSPSGSALSRSQIYGGNVGPNGVTEPADPAFLNNLGNGMMAALKAQYGFINNPYLNNTGGYNPNGGPK